jgi:hypothetical protein
VPLDTKARFAALAARHQLSESGLLPRLVNEVLKASSPVTRELAAQRAARDRPRRCCLGSHHVAVSQRRSNAGGKARWCSRDEDRQLPGDADPQPCLRLGGTAPNELNQIKATGAQLVVLGRQLRVFGMANTLSEPMESELGDAMALVLREVEGAREATAAVVRRNLIS